MAVGWAWVSFMEGLLLELWFGVSALGDVDGVMRDRGL